MSYEENVRAILQACFSQSKDEIIETAVNAIIAIKQEPVIINPTNPTPTLPWYKDWTITTSSSPTNIRTDITC